MPQPLTISVREARRFMLSHLLLTDGKVSGADGVMKIFDRLKCIQFDPLSIAGCNHDIVLQSRVENYRPVMCSELLYGSRKLLDAWDKKMAIIRTVDRPNFHRFHAQTRERLGGSESALFPVLSEVRNRIREQGPLSSRTLNISGEADWWFGAGNWGGPNLGRVALEAMLLWGELIIAHKNNRRKAYDFAEKLLPPEIMKQGDPHSSEESYNEWLVQRRVTAAGIIRKGQSEVWMSTTVLSPVSRNEAITRLLKHNRLLELRVEGVKFPFLVCTEDWSRYEPGKFSSDNIPRFIAPLDNLVWDRTLVSALFGMDYHWEVYDPPQKRKFGYYVLPILMGDELVGRVEPVLKKEDKVMRVKGLWWEPGITPRKIGKKKILQALQGYAQFLGPGEYVLEEGAKENLS